MAARTVGLGQPRTVGLGQPHRANSLLLCATDCYHRAVFRFIVYAVPLLILLLALFGFTVELLDAEPRSGSVIRLALFEQPRVPGQLVIGAWLVEASGLIALFLIAQGRFGAWWLDGLVAGWVAWVFRGPLLVITIVVAAKQPQDPWWKLAFGWWVLYSICGLSLAVLARRSGLPAWAPEESEEVEAEQASEPGDAEAGDAEVDAAETVEVELNESEPGEVEEIETVEVELEEVETETESETSSDLPDAETATGDASKE